MSRAWVLLFGLLIVTPITGQVPNPLVSWEKQVAQVRIGMSADEVRERLGKPTRVARQVIFRRHLEQWIYLTPKRTYVELDCVPGQEARVIAILK